MPPLEIVGDQGGGYDPERLARGVRNPDRIEALLAELRAALREKLAQDRAMATRLILAVAANREIGVLRERRQKVERAPGDRGVHLGPE
jgi:hypothetical protein